jgi:hypothetical protein
MELTQFLAQIWGPVILAIGLGIFVSPKYYSKVYHDLEREPLAILVFAMFAITFGVIHVTLHNVWNTFPEIIISLLGWGLLVKGLVFAIAPSVADMGGNWAARIKLMPAAGGILLIVGGYLSWIAYLA